MTQTDLYDLIVVGAGIPPVQIRISQVEFKRISGIATARFYLETHAHSRVLILERDSCSGGTWNSRRSYYGFYTQWSVGAAEFSDMPMMKPPEEDTYKGFYKAKYTTKYLEEYVDRHNYSGHSLRDRILLHFNVQKLTKLDGMWLVSGVHFSEPKTLTASKLVIASGPTSEPHKPAFQGEAKFAGLILHQDAFGESDVLSNNEIESVAIVGGGKSAADMVYACVKAGKKVSWIIRKNGTGPGYLFPTDGVGPYTNGFELGGARFTTALTPTIFNHDTFLVRFLHGTRIGNWLVRAIWGGFEKQSLAKADYHGRKDALPGFSQLLPHAPLFWTNISGGLLNRPDFWETIAPSVHVYNEDIIDLDKQVIHLSDGEEVSTQCLLLGTGWLSSLQFMDPKQLVELGLPHRIEDEQQADNNSLLWEKLEAQADREVLSQLPMLQNPPEHFYRPPTQTPYRLYKGIGPLEDDTIAFVGFSEFLNYFRGVECQAIWATAFLDKNMSLPSKEEQMAEIARCNVYCRRRYLSSGKKGTFFPFESTLITDRLLEEVGLSSHRKGWFAHTFGVNLAKDLSGLKDEYLAKFGPAQD